MGISSIGFSGLNAAQAGLLTTGHNISNASTPGYHRQEIVQSANGSLFTGAGFIGQGTHVQTVKRVYDEFLGRQVLNAEAGATEMETYRAQISQIDNLLADPSAGLSPALSAFFKGLQDVAANPASVAGRQSMLSAAEALVARFQGLDQRFSEIREGVNQQITAQIGQINVFSTQLADINQRIIMAQASGTNQQPNDLLDQRDTMLRDLNKLVRVSTVAQSDGSFNVFIGQGQPLVVGTRSSSLQAVAAADDPQRKTVAIVGAGGTAQVLSESQINGGSLGGLLSFRNESLDGAQNALGRIAVTLAQNFNDQHRLGQDLTGAMGQDLFTVADPIVRMNSGNGGSGTPAIGIDAATVSELTGSDYRLSFVGGNYQLIRLADNQTRTFASLPQTVDGITIDAATWLPAANDSVLIQPTRAGAREIGLALSDVRQIAAAAPIRSTASLANTGTGRVTAGTVDAPPPPNPDLQHRVTISFTSATSFDVFDVTTSTTLASGVAYASGSDIAYNGWTVRISGNPASGDAFSVEANANGVADNRNIVLLGGLQTRNAIGAEAGSAPTATYQGAYAQIVSAVGSKTNEVEAIGAAQQGLVDHAAQALESLAGVNLDEEAAKLLRYQQAYQASAKVLEIATRIFDEILALGR